MSTKTGSLPPQTSQAFQCIGTRVHERKQLLLSVVNTFGYKLSYTEKVGRLTLEPQDLRQKEIEKEGTSPD